MAAVDTHAGKPPAQRKEMGRHMDGFSPENPGLFIHFSVRPLTTLGQLRHLSQSNLQQTEWESMDSNCLPQRALLRWLRCGDLAFR